jgi:hypothetical protein
MRIPLRQRIVPAIGLGLALSYGSASSLFAQGLPPSSGSGAGTGTGMSSGFPGSTGTGSETLGSRPEPRAFPNPALTRPIDFPADVSDANKAGGLSTVTPDLFLDARSVIDPGERALALVRIAQTAIFSRQFNEAHSALFEAGPAALAEPNPLLREQRLTAIVDSLLRLCEERMVDDVQIESTPLTSPIYSPPTMTPPAGGSTTISPPLPAQTPGSGTPTPGTSPTQSLLPLPATPPPVPAPSAERMNRLKAALPEWAMAVDLSKKIKPATARTEALFRISESESFCSQKLITDPLIRSGVRPDPSKLDPQLRAYTDYLLAASAWHANMIERPIWRDYALFRIVYNAANSSQFKRGFAIARAIEQPEARTDALIRLAEGQAINGRPTEATAAYEEAARSVALIPQEDPRETLVGVLIDSLITYGRFDDARACVPLYSFASRQLTALEAIAESQGRRYLAESARQWIARENPVFQPLLYRKVNDGILAAIELNRSKELNSRSMSAPPLR